ncbi:MAG: acetoin dehydrogenase dihydrolipoyllysine-residue acetyltransferase subunit [bacterium]|nr:acetoin dehydrogenase dihydrolipoyllysine-residue acetyltransferase subunit [bacterium]
MSGRIVPILMPKWGLSMKQGTLSSWLVEEGSEISPGDEIMDVETDKIANALEATDGGLLRKRVGMAGETYPVRALLGVLAPPSVPDSEIDAYVASFTAPVVEEADDEEPVRLFLDLPVGRIRYAERPGDGIPVLLVHGFGGDLDNWLFNIDALAEAGSVVALDLPGHGQSVKSVAAPSLTTMTDAVIGLMDSLGVARAHLVGHSMGGLVAGRIGIDRPDRVASITLIAAAGLGEEINGAYLDGFVSASSRRDLKPALAHLFADQGLVNRSMVEDVLKYKRLDGVGAFLEALRGTLFPGDRQATDIADDLAGIGCPCHAIWGAEDAIIPAAHAGAVEGATVIDGAGHMVQMEKAAEVNRLILSWTSS